MNEGDNTVYQRIGELIGRFDGLSTQVSNMHQTIADHRASAHTELMDHEKRELDRIDKIEKQGTNTQRMVLLASGGLASFIWLISFLERVPK
jgi:hypothetical protein